MESHTSFATTPLLQSAFERAESLLKSLQDCGRTDKANALKTAIDSARQMRFAIGVVGQAKRGKSTLINGLLGRRDDTFAPVDKYPATNVVSCFADGSNEQITVLFADSAKQPKTISKSEIKHYACEELNPGNQKGVKGIQVVAPFTHLGKHVVLVDTPGAGNALSTLHDMVLLEYLPRLDAVIFMVTADEPLIEAELELLRHVKHNDVGKLFFAINKADKCEPHELKEGLEHNRVALRKVGFGDAQIFVTSAKSYLNCGSDDGIESLLFAIGELIGEGRAKAIADRLNEIATRLMEESRFELASELQLREMDTEQAILAKEAHLALQKSITEARPRLDHKFHDGWTAALEDFDDALSPIEGQLLREYTDLIDKTNAVALQGLGQTIHTDIHKRLDELLEVPTRKLREALDDVAKGLEADYKHISSLIPRHFGAIRTNKDILKPVIDCAAAAAPGGLVTFVCASLPGLVGSTVAATAPTVATLVWYNPATWIAAAGTGTAAAATGAASAVATTILTPVAMIGAPLCLFYTGYKVFSIWRSNLAQSRNALALAVKDLIVAAVAETRGNVKGLQKQAKLILREFNERMDTKLSESEQLLDVLSKKHSPPEVILNLRRALKLIEVAKSDTPRSPSDQSPSDSDVPFPI
ncbi:MAG: dynamin family protein [Verrucomicrobia bacterium]|nr:dynamin family protein [Verrucomicrobiota bacterium]